MKYIDLVLLHAPFGGTEGRLGAWKALAEAVEEGTVRSIGVSNYGVQVCLLNHAMVSSILILMCMGSISMN